MVLFVILLLFWFCVVLLFGFEGGGDIGVECLWFLVWDLVIWLGIIGIGFVIDVSVGMKVLFDVVVFVICCIYLMWNLVMKFLFV